eukprot:Mrub_05394.p2 GENE.Mrub_05394~~Mrub_05394.p2  ORF type:complete len:191 (+),score=-8.82 Mrub_05394:430-1002(+)
MHTNSKIPKLSNILLCKYPSSPYTNIPIIKPQMAAPIRACYSIGVWYELAIRSTENKTMSINYLNVVPHHYLELTTSHDSLTAINEAGYRYVTYNILLGFIESENSMLTGGITSKMMSIRYMPYCYSIFGAKYRNTNMFRIRLGSDYWSKTGVHNLQNCYFSNISTESLDPSECKLVIVGLKNVPTYKPS